MIQVLFLHGTSHVPTVHKIVNNRANAHLGSLMLDGLQGSFGSVLPYFGNTLIDLCYLFKGITNNSQSILGQDEADEAD